MRCTTPLDMWLQQLAGGHWSNVDLSLDIAIDHTQWRTARFPLPL